MLTAVAADRMRFEPWSRVDRGRGRRRSGGHGRLFGRRGASESRPAITADRSTLAMLAEYRSWQASLIDARSWRRISRDDVHAAGHARRTRRTRRSVVACRACPGGCLRNRDSATHDGREAGRGARPERSVARNGIGIPAFTLRLPVAAASLSVRADSTAADGIDGYAHPAGADRGAGEQRSPIRAGGPHATAAPGCSSSTNAPTSNQKDSGPARRAAPRW